MNVQLPFCRGNSNVNLRVSPGPRELIPSLDSTFLLSLVWMKISNPPIGIAASLETSTATWMTSSSSSSISIDVDISRHSIGGARVKCSSLIETTPNNRYNR